jgi:hypothetical protein
VVAYLVDTIIMTTITITNPTKTLTGRFDNERDLYQYLVDRIIDIDVREHEMSEFDASTQQLITSIADRPTSSFVNI